MTAADDRFAVLHALRVKGVADAADLERISGVRDPVRVLVGLAEDGLVASQVGGSYHALTEAGRAADARETHDRTAAGRDELAALYDRRFQPANARFKRLCADWQVQGESPEQIEEAADVHDEIAAVLREAAAHAPHLSRYLDRLEAAMDAFLDGDAAALDGYSGDSYHTTWFELHEDLIATLGRTRAREPT